MKSKTTKSVSTSQAKRSSKKAAVEAGLAVCPTGGAGWCPYPFSIAQLKKRLKAKLQTEKTAQAQEEKVLVKSGK